MIFFGLLQFLISPVIIIVLIVFFVSRRRGGVSLPIAQDQDWYLRLALSKEDAVSQVFLLLSVFFLGITLLAFNKDFGDPLSWRTILFLTSLAGLASAYYFKVIYTLAFSLIGITSWWGIQAVLWIDGKDVKASAIFTGLLFIALLFYVVGHLHEKELRFKRFAMVYLTLGLFFVTGVLFFLSTKPGLAVLESMSKGTSFLGSWQLTLSLFLFGGLLMGGTMYAVSKKLISSLELLATIFLTLLFGTIALLPEQNLLVQSRKYSGSALGNEFSSSGILWAAFLNIIVFLETLWLILAGYARREKWLVNLGALFLFILIIIKYFDWFFTFLDKSIFFIGAGILLFVIGWLMERGRRFIISDIKDKDQQSL